MAETELGSGWDGKVVTFVNRRSKLALTAPDASQGAWMIQSKDSGQDLQRWKFTAVPGTVYYKIMNMGSKKYLEILESRKDDGAPVDQWDDNKAQNQQWSVIPDKDSDGDFYRIQNVNSSKTIEPRGGPHEESLKDGTPIIQWHYFGEVNQKWLIYG